MTLLHRLTTGGAFQAALLGSRQRAAPSLLLRNPTSSWAQAWRRGGAIAQHARGVAASGGIARRLLLRMNPAAATTGTSTRKSSSSSSSKAATWWTAAAFRSSTGRTTKIPPPRRSFHFSRTRRSGGKSGGSGSKTFAEDDDSLSWGDRMKRLWKEYYWATLGVYAALTVLDFPFCFLLVRMVGTEKIAEVEHWVKSHASQFIPAHVKETWNAWRHKGKKDEGDDSSSEEEDRVSSSSSSSDGSSVAGAVKEAEERGMEASLGTMLALAYAVHKSFIFIRLPLTVVITPKVVKTLRSWGWQIAKRRNVVKR